MSVLNELSKATGLRRSGLNQLARRGAALLALLCLAGALAARAQDSVTIPKSRLEELERKEAELQRLQQAATNSATNRAIPSNAAPVTAVALPASQAPVPVVSRVSPPMSSLPPFKEGETVDSVDLVNYFRAEPAEAEKRFHGQRIVVRGQIIGFEKPMFMRNYKVLLPGPDQSSKVICDLLTPRKFSSSYTIDQGAQLVGQFGENRQTLARVGQTVLMHGRCKGLKDSSVYIVAEYFDVLP